MISDRIIISSDESMIDYMGKYNMKKAGISLKKQLLIIFLFIAFIPMTVTALLLYHFQTQNALNAEIESQIQVLKLVTSNIYQKLTYFNNLTASIYYHDDIMSCLEKGQATLLSSPDKKRIQPAIDSLMRTDDMILSVSLTTMAGDTLYWNDGYSNAIHINSFLIFYRKYMHIMDQVFYLIPLHIPVSVNTLLQIRPFIMVAFYEV